MNRREFLASCFAAGASATGVSAVAHAAINGYKSAGRFRLNYAPHMGMFKHHAGDDPVDQILFMADHGFRAFEDSALKSRPTSVQQKIRRAAARLNMQIGVFVGTADFGNPTFASGREGLQQRVLADIRKSAALAKRLNARWCTVVPGKIHHRIPTSVQAANAVELLKQCAAICEPAGLTMLLEPINHWPNRPELFLHSLPQAQEICRAVGSPACKVLVDIPHLHQGGGDLISSLDRAWPEIAYLQIGDSPGRKEPGSGKINYRSVFQHLHAKGYRGILGMEHGNSLPGKRGERAVIDAYVAHDAF